MTSRSPPSRPATMMVTTSLVTRLDPASVSVVAVVDGKERIARLRDGEELVVGSVEDAGLRIDEPTVSRQHVRLMPSADGVRVTDLGSTNGTFYEGARVRDVTVPVGASLKLGNASLHLRPHESEIRGAAPVGQFGELVAEDGRMKEMFALLRDVAALDATIIIEGETGTGKELVARALHGASPRAQKPFVVFDCTAVPKDLVESSLFGHVQGAFSEATASRDGAFRRAHGGTLFLDELGELPLELQPKLLRVLENRTVHPVGGDDGHKVDVRIVCATHRDLKAEVRAGRFREDLYYRLAVVKVQLPPLRERPDDIELLARHFARAFLDGKPVPPLEGFERLRSYPFPGNTRELRNMVEAAIAMSGSAPGVKGAPVDVSRALPGTDDAKRAASPSDAHASAAGRVEAVRAAAAEALASPHSFKDAKALVVEAFERVFLEAVMQKAGNLSRGAQAAQMDRKHLREVLRRYGLWSESGADANADD